MTRLKYMSTVYAPTLKEVPAEAEIASHKLLLRAGMIRKAASGIYSYLPLGWRVLKKIENIVREEMEAIGSQEVLLPIVQPAELWHESGRWDVYGPELARLSDRHERQFCLGPTHEEIITALVRGDVRSYRDLPLSLFQINMKFRDEIRPRFGLLRGREFIMKDAYSFHETQESLQEHYDEQTRAYGRICERLGLDYRPVEADSGQIGGSVTTEFMALADAGEAEIVYCDCGFAANTEVGCALIPVAPQKGAQELEKVHTPDAKTIDEVSQVLKVDAADVVKMLVGRDEDGNVVCYLVPGDRELNPIKADRIISGVKMLEPADFKALGMTCGYVGPVNIPLKAKVIADITLRKRANWIVGANEEDYHLIGAQLGRDFEVDQFEDIVNVVAGDLCPSCKKPLSSARGIEVSQVFQLGTKYAEAMGATFQDVAGEDKVMTMGCYGVGVSRCMAAIIEQHHDEYGIQWPMSVAPFQVEVIALSKGDEVAQFAHTFAQQLSDEGIEVILDDRKERPGVKFMDADLLGVPVQIIFGKRGFDLGVAEIKMRQTGQKDTQPIDGLVSYTVDLTKTL